MQSDLVGLGQELVERGERIAARQAPRGDQLVVVDEEEQPGPAPPVAQSEPGGGDVGPRDPLPHRPRHPVDHLPQQSGAGGVAQEVGVGDGLGETTPVVDEDDPRLVGGVPGADAVGDVGEQVGLAGLDVTDDQQVRVLLEIVVEDVEPLVLQTERDPQVAVGGRQSVRGEVHREHPHGRRRRAVPLGGDLPDERGDAVGDGLRARVAVRTGQRGEVVHAVGGETAARDGRDGRRHPHVDHRVDGVAQAQLEAGAELVAEGRGDLHPTAGGDDQVHPEVEAPRGDQVESRGEVHEVLPDGVPAVHDEEDVAVRLVRELALGASAPEVGHGLHAPLGEEQFAVRDDMADLGDGTGHPFRVEAPGDAADVRQPGERGERPAAEVQAVELDVARGVGEGERGDQGAHQGRLAGLGSARDADVAARAGEVGDQFVTALVEGAVDDTDGDGEELPAGHAGRGQQEVERRGLVQRRQPHLVGGRTRALQLVDGHGEQAGAGGVPLLFLRRVRFGLRGGVGQRPGRHPARLERHHLAGDHRLPDRGTYHPVPAGDVGGLEPGESADVVLQQSAARLRGQLVGVRDTEHAPALHRREGAQRDPVGQMALQLADAALVQALRGQQHMHGERAAEPSDHHEEVEEVAVRGEQLAELVDDDEQGGQRVEGGAVRPRLLVLADGGVVPGLAQHLLAADQLAVQGVLHPFDQRGLVGQVGDDGRGVRQPVQTEEGGAALEVGEDEVQRLGGVGERQREHQGAQQLRLAGTGGADQHAVRAHAALCRFLEVEIDVGAVRSDADRDPQPLRGTARTVQTGRIGGVQITDAEQIRQLHVLLERALGPRRGAQPVGGEDGGEGAGRVRSQGVGPAQVRLGGLAVRGGGQQRQRVRSHPQAQRAAGGAGTVHGAADVDDDGVAVAGLGEPGPGRYGRGVQDDDGERFVTARLRSGLERRPARELLAEQRLQLGDRLGHQPGGAHPVDIGLVLHVRQPLGPRPGRQRLAVRHHGDHQVLRGVRHRELADQRPGRGPGDLAVLLLRGEEHPRERPQPDGDRLVADRRIGVDEAAQRVRGERLQVLDRLGGKRREGQRELLLTGADPRLPEVVVGGAPFPQPPGAGDRPQRLGERVTPFLGKPLLLDDLADTAPTGRQVPQVVPALGAQRALAVPGRPEELGDQHADGRGPHHADRHPHQHAVALPRADEDEHHAERAQRHRQVGDDAAHGALGLRQGGRLLQRQFAVGHGRANPARRPPKGDGAQTGSPDRCVGDSISAF